ncbi:hypothetical protein CEY16_05925 [Halalkalibacillus sediminis]|uniref:Sporulation membrane protein YtrI C-terminal domain-containing protein n=1 Tax=Halalkalibacillus sediminis TaxID=2018042 RepID=A0A2I0QY66_9BACI|nr:sporulation membrane protein YtrI [Halalkalibacillus sediminis]PKR79277.1 hypothetical protein CEY16_05925 [Halalkalibacillus sediminis]
MHFPPYYKKKTWQAFFIGIFAGTIIGYMIFIYMYGVHTERWIEENLTLRNELSEVQNENELLKQDKDDLSEENEKKFTIQKVEIEWLNATELKLDRITLLRLNEKVQAQVQPVIGRSIQSVHDQKELLIRTIENKTYPLNDINYQMEVVHMTLSTTMTISLNIDTTN